jgi:hypothetical protein
MLEFLMSEILWIGISILMIILLMVMGIFFYLLFKKTHLSVELSAFFSNTPIAIFFQDNKFAEWKPIAPINGVVYDEIYGPFIATTTYVDKKTKNIIIPFDVDMDGDRTTDIKGLVESFRNVTNNEKSISDLRAAISSETITPDMYVTNVTSHIKYSALKSLFFSSVPHNIKSKIEKMVAERVVKYGDVNVMHAIMIFASIFGMVVLGSILLKTTGGIE